MGRAQAGGLQGMQRSGSVIALVVSDRVHAQHFTPWAQAKGNSSGTPPHSRGVAVFAAQPTGSPSTYGSGRNRYSSTRNADLH